MGSPKHLWSSCTDPTNFRGSSQPSLGHRALGTAEPPPETRRASPSEEGRSHWTWQITPEACKAEKRRNVEMLPLRAEVEDGLFVLIWSCSPSPSLVSH